MKEVKKKILSKAKICADEVPLYIKVIKEYQNEHIKYGTFNVY